MVLGRIRWRFIRWSKRIAENWRNIFDNNWTNQFDDQQYALDNSRIFVRSSNEMRIKPLHLIVEHNVFKILINLFDDRINIFKNRHPAVSNRMQSISNFWNKWPTIYYHSSKTGWERSSNTGRFKKFEEKLFHIIWVIFVHSVSIEGNQSKIIQNRMIFVCSQIIF